MKDIGVQLGPRTRQVVELFLQGYDNNEIARRLKMARRTVKAHFHHMFLRFGITHGIKRVKLATLLYRKQSSSGCSGTTTPGNADIELTASNTSRTGLTRR